MASMSPNKQGAEVPFPLATARLQQDMLLQGLQLLAEVLL